MENKRSKGVFWRMKFKPEMDEVDFYLKNERNLRKQQIAISRHGKGFSSFLIRTGP